MVKYVQTQDYNWGFPFAPSVFQAL